MQQPYFNSFRPQFPNQTQSNSNTNTNTHPLNPQVFSTNTLQNSMPMQQPQMGANMVNPQIPDPFSATHLGSNAQAVPNLSALMGTLQQQQPGFINPQNNILGALQTLQSFIGSAPQNQINNLNALWTLMNQMNPPQVQGQSFAPNPNNLPQQIGPNMGFPNFQYPVQNMNPSIHLQKANLASFSGPWGGNQALGNFPNQFQNTNPAAPLRIPNHGSSSSHQALGPQNPNFMANSMMYPGQQVNSNQSNVMLPKPVGNGPMPLPIAAPQGQGNPPASLQNQISQPSALDLQRGNPLKNGQGSTSNPRWKDISRKNFNNGKAVDLQPGYQKSQFRNMRNEKRKFGHSNHLKGGGYGHERAEKYGPIDPANQAVQKKRSLSLSYTEEEIKLWLEGRRKNYPTEANIQKKQNRINTDLEVTDREAKLRRQQLKEILGKQAELGVEVAEIPSYYLSDSGNQVTNSEGNRRHAKKKGRSRNKFDKRGRFNKNDQPSKQRTYAEANSSKVLSFKKRKPTLLEKLLSKDVRADKHRLLQVFRFMVTNSFFKDWPEKPLEFPLVAGDDRKDEMSQERSFLVGRDVSELANIASEKLGYANDSDGDKDRDDDNRINSIVENNENPSLLEKDGGNPMGKRILIREVVPITEEEEGEIVD